MVPTAFIKRAAYDRRGDDSSLDVERISSARTSYPPVAIIGSKGGSATANRLGSEHYRRGSWHAAAAADRTRLSNSYSTSRAFLSVAVYCKVRTPKGIPFASTQNNEITVDGKVQVAEFVSVRSP